MNRADKQAQTPGPWIQRGEMVVKNRPMLGAYHEVSVLSLEREPSERIANAARIVACVNACESVPTDGVDACKEFGGLRFILDALDKVTRDRKALKAENTRLREALQSVVGVFEGQEDAPLYARKARAALKVTA